MYYIFICWIDIFIFSVHCFLFTGSLQDISLKSLPHRRSFRWSVWQINTDVSPPRWHDTLDEFSISISLCRQENVTKSHLLLTISAASVNKAYQEMRQACFWGEELAAGANPAYRIPPRPHSNTQKRKRRPWISAPGLSARYVSAQLSLLFSLRETNFLHRSALNLAQFNAALSEILPWPFSRWVCGPPCSLGSPLTPAQRGDKLSASVNLLQRLWWLWRSGTICAVGTNR